MTKWRLKHFSSSIPLGKIVPITCCRRLPGNFWKRKEWLLLPVPLTTQLDIVPKPRRFCLRDSDEVSQLTAASQVQSKRCGEPFLDRAKAVRSMEWAASWAVCMRYGFVADRGALAQQARLERIAESQSACSGSTDWIRMIGAVHSAV